MTTNQTIDGVPRKICHACVTLARNAYCPVCDDAPVAQPQGEPVAYSYKVRVHATGIGMVWRDKVEREAPETEAVEVKDLMPLYAEQPAPVAVVLPERNKASKNLDLEQCGWVDGWNACLDEVTRLNTK